MKLANMSSEATKAPKIIGYATSPATLKIYFPSDSKTYEYVIYDNLEMRQLMNKFKFSTGKLVAELKRRKYTVVDITADRNKQFA